MTHEMDDPSVGPTLDLTDTAPPPGFSQHNTDIIPVPGAAGEPVPVTPIAWFGTVAIYDDGTVSTPAGYAPLSRVTASIGPSSQTTQSRPEWSTPMVLVSVIVGLFTCGLGLLLLFLSRSQSVYTVTQESVIFDAPNFQYVAHGEGAAQMVGWLTTWKRQLEAS